MHYFSFAHCIVEFECHSSEMPSCAREWGGFQGNPMINFGMVTTERWLVDKVSASWTETMWTNYNCSLTLTYLFFVLEKFPQNGTRKLVELPFDSPISWTHVRCYGSVCMRCELNSLYFFFVVCVDESVFVTNDIVNVSGCHLVNAAVQFTSSNWLETQLRDRLPFTRSIVLCCVRTYIFRRYFVYLRTDINNNRIR